MQLKDVMTTKVQLTDPSAKLKEAAMAMRDGDFGLLPVGANDRLVGTITDRDITVRAVAEGRDPNTTTVGDVMSEGIRYCFEDQDGEAAARLMSEAQVRRLPVLNRDKRLVGIVALGRPRDRDPLRRAGRRGPERHLAALARFRAPGRHRTGPARAQFEVPRGRSEMTRARYALIGAAAMTTLVAAPLQGQAQDAVAELIDDKANPVGTAQLNQLEQGVQIVVAVSGLPAGKHALHIHETGECEPPFESAGGHFNPTDADHGWNSEGGPHAGDLPNIYLGEGAVQVEYITDRVTLEDGEASLLDDDGSAIIIHQGQDDYQTEPAGDAGTRIACGVIEQSG